MRNTSAWGPADRPPSLANGKQIQFTQSALVLENLVNKFFASVAGGKKDDQNKKDDNATKDDNAKK